MKEIKYFFIKVKYLLPGRNKEVINQYYRKIGMHIGKGCNIVSNITTTEPWLISIGDNSTLAGGVVLCTHDNSISKVVPDSTDLFGKITIGKNCFIGQESLILYGVTLADNIIVAAGSVVTKSFTQERIIIGGNPAKIIGTYDSFAKKNVNKAFNLVTMRKDKLKENILSSNKLITRGKNEF